MLREGSLFTQWALWAPDSDGALHRTGVKSWNRYDSRYTNITLTQARIGEIMAEYIREKCADMEIRRATIVEGLSVRDGEEYPVEVRTRNVRRTINGETTEAQASNGIRVDDDEDLLKTSIDTRTIHAKYVVACDGAHSWTRRQLDIAMVGDDTDVIWGVMDVLPDTDFPSTRALNSVLGAGFGLLLVPRERGLIRVYTTLAMPYRFSYKTCEWWAAYQIGQRISTANIDSSGRVFLAGDAVHTHSPQAGQGINVGIQDVWNVMWRLNLVVKQSAKPDIPQTYSEERLKVAQDLVNFDRQFAAMASGQPTPQGLFGRQSWSIQHFFHRIGVMVAGLHVHSESSVLTCTSKEDLEVAQKALSSGKVPPGMVVGMRLKPATIYRHEDALKVEFTGHEAFQSDDRFRILLFVGNLRTADNMERLQHVASKLSVLLSRYVSKVFDIVILHTANPTDLGLSKPVARAQETLGSNTRIFFDGQLVDGKLVSSGAAYKTYHVDAEAGKLVLLRPDQYIAYVGELTNVETVER
ncbi:hypothetical protein LTS14_002432 [Recurvomyces mirabilis]|uniref:uncharacterized protein n=1 Tax=Recurvomyces mirabilis TaxID=574656 RepID=UPI002DDFDABC|nr:hypothetical protein LTS14_002432 [Recurvomyces mirabilis]